MTSKPHSVSVAVERARRLLAVEDGHLEYHPLALEDAQALVDLFEQLEVTQRELDQCRQAFHDRSTPVISQLEGSWRECSEHRERILEQLKAVVEATRFKNDEDCWCSFRQVDDPDWHSSECERVREVLGISNPASEPDGADLVREIRDTRGEEILEASNQDRERP